MKAMLCAVLVSGCTGGDCAILAARYAEAFLQAQRCDPGRDTCTGSAPSASVERLADGGIEISIDACMNSCEGPNVNPKRSGSLQSLLNAYRDACEHPMGCMCPNTLDGGPLPYTCKPTEDGGGLCSP